ncbi:MAG: ribonuclease H [Pseudothermotoga sp.]
MVIYTDGSYSEQAGILGYAFCCVEDRVIKQISDAFVLENGSSTIAEIVAVSKSLEFCLNYDIHKPLIVHDFDAIPFLALGYRACRPYMQEFVDELQRLTQIVEPDFQKVKAHDGHFYNTLAHNLAVEAVRKLRDGQTEIKEVRTRKPPREMNPEVQLSRFKTLCKNYHSLLYW